MKNIAKLVIVIVVLILLALGGIIYLLHAYDYNMIGSNGGNLACYQINPDELPCEGVGGPVPGNVVGIQLYSASGWFFGLGRQPKLNVTVFVPATNATFTQTYLGCAGPFRIGQNITVGIGIYNATYLYNPSGNPNAEAQNVSIANAQFTNTSLDKSTNITVSTPTGLTTTKIDEIGRSYFVVPVPAGCKVQ